MTLVRPDRAKGRARGRRRPGLRRPASRGRVRPRRLPRHRPRDGPRARRGADARRVLHPGRAVRGAPGRAPGRGASARRPIAAFWPSQDAIIICVPTPLRKSKDPDISYVVSAAEAVARASPRAASWSSWRARPIPGTTDEVLLPTFRARRARRRSRLLPGLLPRADRSRQQAVHRQATIPKVVGGVTPACTRLAALLYRQIVQRRLRGLQPDGGRARQALREHVPQRQHRARQRAGPHVPPPRADVVGGHRRRRDQAVRVHAVLSRAGHRRPLHPDRSVLPVVEGCA